jgi:hypothetical protein
LLSLRPILKSARSAGVGVGQAAEAEPKWRRPPSPEESQQLPAPGYFRSGPNRDRAGRPVPDASGVADQLADPQDESWSDPASDQQP